MNDKTNNKQMIYGDTNDGSTNILELYNSDGDRVADIDTNGNITSFSTIDSKSSIQVSDNSDAATSTNVGSIRYRTSGNNSYCEMSMQTGASTYAWVTITSNSW